MKNVSILKLLSAGEIDAAEVLLSLRPPQVCFNFKERDDIGNTALIKAGALGAARVIELLLADPEVDANAYNITGATGLIEAIRYGRYDAVAAFADNERVDVDFRGRNGFGSRTETASELIARLGYWPFEIMLQNARLRKKASK